MRAGDKQMKTESALAQVTSEAPVEKENESKAAGFFRSNVWILMLPSASNKLYFYPVQN